ARAREGTGTALPAGERGKDGCGNDCRHTPTSAATTEACSSSSVAEASGSDSAKFRTGGLDCGYCGGGCGLWNSAPWRHFIRGSARVVAASGNTDTAAERATVFAPQAPGPAPDRKRRFTRSAARQTRVEGIVGNGNAVSPD